MCTKWWEGDDLLVCWWRHEQLSRFSLLETGEKQEETTCVSCACCLWFASLHNYRCWTREWKAKAQVSIGQTCSPAPPYNSIPSHCLLVQEDLGTARFIQISFFPLGKCCETEVGNGRVLWFHHIQHQGKSCCEFWTCVHCWEAKGSLALQALQAASRKDETWTSRWWSFSLLPIITYGESREIFCAAAV